MTEIIDKNKPIPVDPNCGVCSQLLTIDEISKLFNNKAISVEVNGGEYTLFIGCDLFFSEDELDKLAVECARKWRKEHGG